MQQSGLKRGSYITQPLRAHGIYPLTGGQTVFKLRYAAIVHIITIFVCGINTVDLAYQDIAHFLCMAHVCQDAAHAGHLMYKTT